MPPPHDRQIRQLHGKVALWKFPLPSQDRALARPGPCDPSREPSLPLLSPRKLPDIRSPSHSYVDALLSPRQPLWAQAPPPPPDAATAEVALAPPATTLELGDECSPPKDIAVGHRTATTAFSPSVYRAVTPFITEQTRRSAGLPSAFLQPEPSAKAFLGAPATPLVAPRPLDAPPCVEAVANSPSIKPRQKATQATGL